MRIFRAVKCVSDFGVFFGYVTVDILDKLDFGGLKMLKAPTMSAKKQNTPDYLGIFYFLCTV